MALGDSKGQVELRDVVSGGLLAIKEVSVTLESFSLAVLD
jgi:hypothetical protein